MNLKEKRISIIGTGKSGLAAATLAKKHGASVFISDFNDIEKFKKDEIQAEFDCEFGGHSSKVLEAELIIVSPGVPLNIPILKQARENKIKIIGEIEFGFMMKAKDSKIIAITGSNGKSTTVSLLYFLLNKISDKVVLAGNIGTAFTSLPIDKPGIDYIILELSSFQLDLIDSFRPDVAAVLNITPDHLNRYDSFKDYSLSKFRIFMNQNKNDLAIINRDCPVSQENKPLIPQAKIREFSLSVTADCFADSSEKVNLCKDKIDISKRKILGPHNKANILAALLIWHHLKLDIEIFANNLEEFSPLNHRLELVKKINNITFINDSKATNTDSVKYALNSFTNPIHLIIGGSGKGEDYSVLNKLIREKCSRIYLIGETKNEMESVFSSTGLPINSYETLQSATIFAFKNAKKGEIVLLSPACASYDMFKNFEDRGDQFKQIVQSLRWSK